MGKREYLSPSTTVISVGIMHNILDASVVTVDSNSGISLGGAGDGTSENGGAARSRQSSVWYEDESELE